MRVSDTGPGGADERLGSGLRGLADRVEAVDGPLTIEQPRRRRHPTHREVPVRVAVVDDGVLFRRGLVHLLQEEAIEVVAEAGDVEELTRALETTSPDVVVLDIRMPPTYTSKGSTPLHRSVAITLGEFAVLVLSQYVEPHAAVSLLSEGTERIRYLLKDHVTDPTEFVDAIDLSRAAARHRSSRRGTALVETARARLRSSHSVPASATSSA